MKHLILTLIFFQIAFTTYSQKIALLDKNFKQPILFTDSISAEQLKSGLFPLQISTIDTFHANIKYLADMLSIRQRTKMQSFELKAGSCTIKISRIPFAYGDRYSGTANSQFSEMSASITLINQNNSNKDNAKKMEKLLEYLDKNKSLFRNPYTITPKIYNVVVITE